jgi:indole-3-glycerol phosphate synthase
MADTVETVMSGTLQAILTSTRASVELRKAAEPPGFMQRRIMSAGLPRPFFDAMTAGRPLFPNVNAAKPRIIAEIKRKSPSAGLIRPEYAGEDFDPGSIARAYEAAGASAISCLTERDYFDGHVSFLQRVKAACSLPVLRKDFIIDSWQLQESRANGADAVLLIAECLPGEQLRELAEEAQQYWLGVLIESHDEHNFSRSLKVVEAINAYIIPDGPQEGKITYGGALLGINNRNLDTLEVDKDHCLRIAAGLSPSQRQLLVNESGVGSPGDIEKLEEAGVRGALVGEHLMRASDPGLALAELLAG